MLWLKARSLIALGITTATLNGSAITSSVASGSAGCSGAVVGAGASVAGAGAQALRTRARTINTPNNLKNLFILSPYLIFESPETYDRNRKRPVNEENHLLFFPVYIYTMIT